MEKAQLYTAEEAIDRVQIWSMTNENIKINMTSIKVWRMNYPHNCFALDLTNNTEVEQKGVKQMYFYFPVMENTSVSILLKGKSLACNREIKANQFFSSGDDVTLPNLGERVIYIVVFSSIFGVSRFDKNHNTRSRL